MRQQTRYVVVLRGVGGPQPDRHQVEEPALSLRQALCLAAACRNGFTNVIQTAPPSRARAPDQARIAAPKNSVNSVPST